jgi:hypothetical protein
MVLFPVFDDVNKRVAEWEGLGLMLAIAGC